MVIRFYISFNKRINSTKLPSNNDSYTEVDCKLLDGTSLTNPVVLIESTVTLQHPESIRYVYIPTFHRYYFVKDIMSSNNLWFVFLTVDVLASFRHDIRNSKQYVLRSSVSWNNDIVDGIYPTINSSYIHVEPGTLSNNYDESTLTADGNGRYTIKRRPVMIGSGVWSNDTTYFKQGLSSGGFVVGLVSNNGTGVTYYAMTRSDLVGFLGKVLTLVPSDASDLSNGSAKMLFNSIQYIVSVKWYPALPTIPGSQSSETNIKIGGYDCDVSSYHIYDISSNYVEEFYFELDLPNHPKRITDTYGDLHYLNLSPYTQYNLYFAPFGNIAIDTTKVYEANSIKVQWSIDFTTGASILKLFRGDYGSQLFYTANSQLGVNLPVSSLHVTDALGYGLTTAYLGLKELQSSPLRSSIQNWLDSNITDFSWLDPRFKNAGKSIMKGLGFERINDNTVSDAIDMGIDALASSLGQVQTVGKPDSFLSYFEIPVLYAWFLDMAEPDLERFGRPLNEMKYLYSVSGGYVKCADSNVEFEDNIPTIIEQSQINAHLNRGVFLE